MRYGLEAHQWELLERFVIRPLKDAGAKVWIFGSRANGNFTKFSDVDVLFSGVMNSSLVSQIKEDIEESTLSIKVDLVSLDELAEAYRENVIRERILL